MNTGIQILRLRPELSFYVYIVANHRNRTLHDGIAHDLSRRIWEHKSKTLKGFTAKCGCDQLVWSEVCDTRDAAFARERPVKEWRRSWKLMLIEQAKPDWNDLYETLNP